MYLPRQLISKLYVHLQQTRHPLSPPVLILVALEPDALCACRILTRLLKHDYIPHKIQPVAGYTDLEKAGRELVVPMMESQGGSGGVVVCLGVGGMVDLGPLLGLEPEGDDQPYSGVEVWVMDAHRPWNLGNVFGGFPLDPETEVSSSYQSRCPTGVNGGMIESAFKPGKGGIIVFDDGDIVDDMQTERNAYLELMEMPEIDDDGEDLGDTDDEDDDENPNDIIPEPVRAGQKRKSWSDAEDESDDDRPHQRRRSNSSSSIAESPRRPQQRGLISMRQPDLGLSSDAIEPPSGAQLPAGPSLRAQKRQLLRLRQKHEAILHQYYKVGSSFSEPLSSMMYSLASDLGRADNDLLWLSIVGVTSMELYGRSSAGIAAPVRQSDKSRPTGWLGARGARIRQEFRDEVRRLNPPELANGRVAAENAGVIPTTARNPEDTGIRLSPEPRFLLIRHWSLYDSMLHSPYLFSRLKTWSEAGIKRLHKLLAKMGVSLAQCKQSYTHMDMMLKRELRAKLLKYGSLYNLDEMVPSVDTDGKDRAGAKDGWGFVRSWGWRATLSAQDVGVVIGALLEVGKHVQNPDLAVIASQAGRDAEEEAEFAAQGEEWIERFWEAYDALENIDALKAGLPTAQFLHRAIYRTGTSLINKKQIKHLRAFRMCVVKEGPDVSLFTHPAALTKLSLWIGEALAEQERETHGKLSHGGRGTPLVVASLNEKRGVYVVVGTGGGGGPDTTLLDREAAKKRKAEREEKLKKKEESRLAKQKIREDKRAARRDAGDDDDELETESEDSDSSDSDASDDEDVEHEKGYGLNKFGIAFQEVVAETNTRVRIDSFEHCVVEVKKEDLGGFLESLSMKVVVG
ncbi:cell division control protein 45 [Fusarium oxysporum f. sp. raphani 54005]|uniref:Cell division control protein 45 n=2 Tax=Fusarium oxysporum f. sp. raphani TaxID=96318 RepID=X0DIP4_FUSOX|nr:cell division control protein 45 [Fusarium oxysporum f. sp. raphani 54005]KAG7432518.1 Cell division control protein 45-like protein [Fusarium oxysporum f. sp. raphani]KAJ4042395.1 DNA replication initiation factor cdc45 [Fusarium oxysporum]KAJ4068171.1 DNA replication initiation factor cdc45 [Fusarium oxysporum]KAJ4086286.1 DNA replication initiation factor cdc45 [Fusarium oxysporum]